MSNLKFSAEVWEDYLYWQSSDRKILKRINDLIKTSVRIPFEGIGKPEPLKAISQPGGLDGLPMLSEWSIKSRAIPC